jgi:hypothetical protein
MNIRFRDVALTVLPANVLKRTAGPEKSNQKTGGAFFID